MISVHVFGGYAAAFAQNPTSEGQKFLHGMAKNNELLQRAPPERDR